MNCIAINYRTRILNTLYVFSALSVFVLSSSYVHANPVSDDASIQVTWSKPASVPDHYRIEFVTFHASDDQAHPVTKTLYSRENAVQLPLSSDYSYELRIQAVTQHGTVSDYSEKITIPAGISADALAFSSLDANKPSTFVLYPNSPNPFNPTTTLSFHLPLKTKVRITVYTVTGQQVATLNDSSLDAGRHSVTWNAAGFPSGLYFYTISAGNVHEKGKMTLLK